MALTDKLFAIGEAIREKTGKTELLTLDAMPVEIASITSGEEFPEEAFVITGTCAYRFGYDGWNWFIENYSERITTEKVSNASGMFTGASSLTNIPFEINFSPVALSHAAGSMFSSCGKLTQLPKLNNFIPSDVSYFISNCRKIKEIPEDYIDNWDWSYMQKQTSGNNGKMNNMFNGCNILRSIPKNLFSQNHINRYSNSSNTIYYGGFSNCYVLDEIKFPVYDKSTWTSNAFYSMSMIDRLKSLTFNTNEDGTPIVVTGKWSKQTINLSNNIGHAAGASNQILNTGSGITEATQVTDDASYQALKNNPDYWTSDVNYSRFNHDSAVEMINTLPDVTSGTGNAITFKGASGALTDGGAINTLTEEEIAVATAKGWTITFV